MRKPLIPALVLLASAGLVALTGCSGASDDTADTEPTTSNSAPATEETAAEEEASSGEQSVEEACQIANSAVTEVQADVSEAFSGMSGGDFSGAAEALTLIQGQLEEASSQVTNTEVKTAVDDVLADFTVVAEQVNLAATQGAESVDQNALSTAATELQTGSQNLQTLCS